MWGDFGGDGHLDFRSKHDGSWAGPISCLGERESVLAEYENQIYTKSWGESGVRVWGDSGQVGELEFPTDDVDSVSGTKDAILLGEWLVNRSHFDCGLQTVPNSDIGNAYARALLAFDSPVSSSSGTAPQKNGDALEKRCELPSQDRVLIASGNQMRVLNVKTGREMASIYFDSTVVGFTSSNGGNCVLVKCQEESYVLDQLPLESKKAYWQMLPKLIPQAEEMAREKLSSTMATDDLEKSISNIPSISESLRLSVLCVCRRELGDNKSKAQWVEKEINQGNPFAVRHRLEDWKKNGVIEELKSIDRRVVSEVNKLLDKSNSPSLDEFEKKVYGFIENILDNNYSEQAEYKEALETAIQSVKEFGNNARRLHLIAAANFRLGNIDESLNMIGRSTELAGSENSVDVQNTALRLLCHLKKNELTEAEAQFDRLEKGYRQLSEGYPIALANEAIQRFAVIVKKPIVEKLGQPHLALTDYQEAYTAAQAGINRFGPDVDWLHLLGLAQLRLDKPDVALRWIERSNEADGRLYSNIPVEVLCQIRLGKVDDARDLMADFEIKYAKLNSPSVRLKSLTEEARKKLNAVIPSAQDAGGK